MTDILPRPRTVLTDHADVLTAEHLRRLRASFTDHPTSRVAQNAVAQNTIDDVALNRSVITGIDHTFSTRLDDWSVTNQKQTGRCWMFAGLNLLRWTARTTMGVKEVEFSQNYTMFWDKVER